MSTKTETFIGTRHYPIAGHYLELLTTVQAVNVRAYDKSDNCIVDARNVESGFYIDRRNKERFVRFEIETQASEEVSFIVTDGESGSKRTRVEGQLEISQVASGEQQAVLDIDSGASEVVLAADPTRRKIYFRGQNGNTGRIALAPTSSVTAAGSAIQLSEGDQHMEIEAAALEWHAIGSADNQNLQIVTFND